MNISEEIAVHSFIEIVEMEVKLKGPTLEEVRYEFATKMEAMRFAQGLQRIVEIFTNVKISIIANTQ